MLGHARLKGISPKPPHLRGGLFAMNTHALTGLAFLSLAVVFGAGCAAKHSSASDGSGTDAVDEGSDANATESDTESLTTSLAAGKDDKGNVGLSAKSDLMLSDDGDIHPSNIGDIAKGYFQPAGCLDVTVAGTTA